MSIDPCLGQRESADGTEEEVVAQAWPSGLAVTVTMDDGSTRDTRTRSEPWKLGGHTWVVLLVGIRGGYLLERCVPRREEPTHD